MTTQSDNAFDRRILLGAAGLAALAASRANAGPLNPPAGAVTSTQKPLAELEPRIAINAANTPGNASAVYRITQPGSYYLTGNITIAPADSAKHAIDVATSGVTIDLCGFEIEGLGALGGANVSGINVQSSSSTGTKVVNGSVRSFGGAGLNLKGQSIVSRIGVRLCGTTAGQPGVRVWAGSVVDSCTVRESGNGAPGIRCDDRGVVRDCTVYSAGTEGVLTGGSTVVERCVVHQCGRGITIGDGSLVRASIVELTGGLGFDLGPNCCAVECLASDCESAGFRIQTGATARACTSHSSDTGFLMLTGAIAQDCVAMSNATHGFNMQLNFPRSRAEGCYARSNGTGFSVQGTACFVARCIATLNTVNNWDVSAGNHCFVISAVDTAPAFTGDFGGVSPGSTNPNANYTI